MARSHVLSACFLAVVFAIVSSTAFFSSSPAFAEEKKQTVRREMADPLKAGQTDIQQKKFKDALAELQKADAMSDKTPYERYVIEGLRIQVYQQTSDYPNLAKAIEAQLATGLVPAEDNLKLINVMAKISVNDKDYPKAIEYINRYFKEGGTDESLQLLLGQIYYLQNDYANAEKIFRQRIQAVQKAGGTPEENLLQTYMSAAYNLKDQPSYYDALQLLLISYPKRDYWNDVLIAVQKKPGYSSKLELDVDRLMLATGVMQQAGEYMEASQLAIADGLPGDAKLFISAGYAAGVLNSKAADAARQQRLSEMANRLSNEDLKSLPSQIQQADASAEGTAWVKLGEAYLSYGQYDNAISAFQKGMTKGGEKNPQADKLHLGLAYLKAGQKQKAKDTLKLVTGADGTQDLAQLWLIQAGLH